MEIIVSGIMFLLIVSHFELYRRIGSLSAKVELVWNEINHKKGGGK